MSHILIISLGPIQDFIAAARRCRDLWFGSWLLSELSKAVAKGVCGVVGFENLVFPGVRAESELDPNNKTSVANKIVAIIRKTNDPESVAEAGRAALRNRLKGLATDVFNGIQDREAEAHWEDFFQRKTAIDQLKDLIEFLWVSVSFDSDTDYPNARKQAEALLAQRKRTLLWTQPKWNPEPGIPKSSLDGQRESVIHEDVFDLVKGKTHFEGRLRHIYGVKKNERLCGVGLLKRLGKRHKDAGAHQFLSTPHLATGSLLQRIDNEAPRIAPHWDAYLGALNGLADNERIEETAARKHSVLGNYDGMLLHETRLEEWFEHLPNDPRNNKRREAFIKAQQALRDFFTATKLPRPSPYFAILMADGDRMGEVIKHRDSVEEHQNLSQALDKFAQNARTIVEDDHFGELIYSGGDDVLAFVPLDRVLECAQALADNFKKKLEGFRDSEGNSPTLSVGIAICHFIEPMSRALDLARKAEKEAKSWPGKNALAVIVDKRSGPPTMACGTWGSVNEEVLRFADWHRHEEISDGIAHELLELHTLLANAENEHVATLQELVRKETERILLRKRPKSGQEEIDRNIVRELLDVPEKLAERLLIARVIADAKDIAEGKPIPRELTSVAEKIEAAV